MYTQITFIMVFGAFIPFIVTKYASPSLKEEHKVVKKSSLIDNNISVCTLSSNEEKELSFINGRVSTPLGSIPRIVQKQLTDAINQYINKQNFKYLTIIAAYIGVLTEDELYQLIKTNSLLFDNNLLKEIAADTISNISKLKKGDVPKYVNGSKVLHRTSSNKSQKVSSVDNSLCIMCGVKHNGDKSSYCSVDCIKVCIKLRKFYIK